jgi:hypothetical protein
VGVDVTELVAVFSEGVEATWCQAEMWPVSNLPAVRTSARRMPSPSARRQRSSTAETVVSTGAVVLVQLASEMRAVVVT